MTNTDRIKHVDKIRICPKCGKQLTKLIQQKENGKWSVLIKCPNSGEVHVNYLRNSIDNMFLAIRYAYQFLQNYPVKE